MQRVERIRTLGERNILMLLIRNCFNLSSILTLMMKTHEHRQESEVFLYFVTLQFKELERKRSNDFFSFTTSLEDVDFKLVVSIL